MKKKNLLFLLVGLIIVGVGYSQTITVISPHRGDVWEKGKTYTIRWTKIGNMISIVKISLMHNERKILGITDSTFNDGSFRWTIPKSIGDGEYRIRVQTTDNHVYDYSEVFRIKSEPAVLIPKPDFKPIKIGVEKRSNYIYGRFENIGLADYSGPLLITARIESSPVTSIKSITRLGSDYLHFRKKMNLTFPHGTLASVAFVHFHRTLKHYCFMVEMNINPDRSVEESDYSNNKLRKIVSWRGDNEVDLGIREISIKNFQTGRYIRIRRNGEISINEDYVNNNGRVHYLEFAVRVINSGGKDVPGGAAYVKAAKDDRRLSLLPLSGRFPHFALPKCSSKTIYYSINILLLGSNKGRTKMSFDVFDNSSGHNVISEKLFDDNFFKFNLKYDFSTIP